MEKSAVDRSMIPLDKSWTIRMGVLDMLSGKDDTIRFLKGKKNLGDDLLALQRTSREWPDSKEVHVGESGTLYRFLRFASWKLGAEKEFILEGTLKDRQMCNNPDIVNYPISELLKLDNNTSQWASASVLLGNNERIINPPFKLQVTYDAVDHWNAQRSKGETWISKYDGAILAQAEAFVGLMYKGKIEFLPVQSEDYCFSRAFKLIDRAEGERMWPSLAGHESNRLNAMEMCLKLLKDGSEIDSRDHRVVQSIAMLSRSQGLGVRFTYAQSVNKSWPQFWKFMSTYGK